MNFSTLILAAGKGTRMKSAKPKVLHQACGKALLQHVIDSFNAAGSKTNYIVVGHGGEEVVASLEGQEFQEVWQKEQKGTGHAVQVALPLLKGADTLLIVNGDGPLLTKETIKKFVEEHKKSKAQLTLGIMEPQNPFGYGRVILAGKTLKAIVEEKEATPKQKKIGLVNGGFYAIEMSFLRALLPELKPSKLTGEIYLTDLIALGAKRKKKQAVFKIAEQELAGVNDLGQLAEVAAVIRQRKVMDWLRDGVTIEHPQTLFVDANVVIEPGAVIGPNVQIKGASIVRAGASVEAGSIIKNSEICSGAEIKAYSYIEDAKVGEGSMVGPFARLRPGTVLGEECKIGNFVELKNAKFGRDSKASHLSYVGDAEIGDDVNIGCGFVACNYDGVNKHKTTIKNHAFIGSNVNAVAPVVIGEGAYIATGSTITKDVPADALAIARAKQENKEGYASRIKGRLLAIKKNKGN